MLRRDRIIRQVLREKFILTMKSGEAFEGLLVEADEKSFRLANAAGVDGTKRLTVDGELFVPRAEVLYMQRVPQ